jgi:hypothetical protein
VKRDALQQPYTLSTQSQAGSFIDAHRLFLLLCCCCFLSGAHRDGLSPRSQCPLGEAIASLPHSSKSECSSAHVQNTPARQPRKQLQLLLFRFSFPTHAHCSRLVVAALHINVNSATRFERTKRREKSLNSDETEMSEEPGTRAKQRGDQSSSLSSSSSSSESNMLNSFFFA